MARATIFTGHYLNDFTAIPAGYEVGNTFRPEADELMYGYRVHLGRIPDPYKGTVFTISLRLYHRMGLDVIRTGTLRMAFQENAAYDINFSSPYTVKRHVLYSVTVHAYYTSFLSGEVNEQHTHEYLTPTVDHIFTYLNEYIYRLEGNPWQYASGREFSLQEIVEHPNTSPNTPSNVQSVSSSYDRTPKFSALVSDPDPYDKVRARFRIRNSLNSIVATFDSPLVTNGNDASAEYVQTLNLGNYTVEAQAIDDKGQGSSYSDPVDFRVTSRLLVIYTLEWAARGFVQGVYNIKWDAAELNTVLYKFLWNILVELDLTHELKWAQKTPWEELPLDSSETVWEEVK